MCRLLYVVFSSSSVERLQVYLDRPTVGFLEMKEQIAWPSLGANSCNHCPPPLTRKPKPCSETVKDPNGEGPLETTTPLQIEPAIWQDMSRPLYSGCEHDSVACERAFKRIGIIDSVLFDCKEAEQTVHRILQNCSIWRQQRHQLWPQDESTTKLWGTAEDLHRTIQFLATCRLRVKARLIDRRRRRRSVDPPLSL